jgi:tetratricopeptide (TPR) repeat protein
MPSHAPWSVLKAWHASSSTQSDAAAILRDALRDYEGAHSLADTETSVHRFFRSYCDRALFNRLMANEGQKTILVPDAYYQARLMLAQAALAGGEAEEARRQSASMMVLAPMDTSAYLLHAQAQTALGDLEGAKETLILLLEHAYDPETLGNAYAALAQIFEQIGDEMASAASWRRCTRFVSSSYLMAVMNLNSLSQKKPTEMAKMETDEDVDYVLASHNVPAAPTEEVSEAFVLAMRAAFDAEVFPVAKNFVDVLAMLSGDDVVLDISRSLEGEPDR